MKIAHVFISGFVQGVGYRAFVKSNARKKNIKGWVRNLSDGRVEAMFYGQQNDVKELLSICNKGPFLSEVKVVQVQWEEIDNKFDGFQILPTL